MSTNSRHVNGKLIATRDILAGQLVSFPGYEVGIKEPVCIGVAAHDKNVGEEIIWNGGNTEDIIVKTGEDVDQKEVYGAVDISVMIDREDVGTDETFLLLEFEEFLHMIQSSINEWNNTVNNILTLKMKEVDVDDISD